MEKQIHTVLLICIIVGGRRLTGSYESDPSDWVILDFELSKVSFSDQKKDIQSYFPKSISKFFFCVNFWSKVLHIAIPTASMLICLMM